MSDWKNNPAITAIIAGSVVLTTTLLVIFNYALPVYQQADKNTIAELNMDLGVQKRSISTYEEKNNQLLAENTSLKNEINGYKDYQLKISLTSIFQKNNPLPIGYAKVLPGMTSDDIYDSYEKVRIFTTKNQSYLTVKPNLGGLGGITYYIGYDDDPKLITHIFVRKYDIFIPMTDEEKELKIYIDRLSLLDFLKENLGPSIKCGNSGYIWNINHDPYYIYFNTDYPDQYSIWLNGLTKYDMEEDCTREVMKLFKNNKH
ncbi:hypothetical protein ISO70_03545 [Morganella morganii subsp. morganii]|uniref:hypothetical protein n=1 Tax=Morganella morganii TaxID=582 RepID=UPI001BDAE8C9|nr:hypothetical protein [Morganella morganii]MBT0351728.1 hypothetical protein [Morganella morganii subsp. morganii]